MILRVLVSMVIVFLLSLPAVAADFEVGCLGAGGGDYEADMTSFLYRPAGAKDWSLLMDGGSVAAGIVALAAKQGTDTAALDPQGRAELVAATLNSVEGMLTTHSHLDHVSGFSILGPLFLHLNGQGKKSFRVLASPETLDNLEEHLYFKKIWGNFGYFPKGNTVLAWERVGDTTTVEIGGFKARRMLLNHKVESSAWLLEAASGGAFFHCGDTGTLPVDVIQTIRGLQTAGKLKGLGLEVSFPSAEKDLAERTTHLTRDTLLATLAEIVEIPVPADPFPWPAETVKNLATQVAAKFKTPVLVYHIKPMQYRAVRAELEELIAAGLQLVVAQQGSCYSF